MFPSPKALDPTCVVRNRPHDLAYTRSVSYGVGDTDKLQRCSLHLVTQGGRSRRRASLSSQRGHTSGLPVRPHFLSPGKEVKTCMRWLLHGLSRTSMAGVAVRNLFGEVLPCPAKHMGACSSPFKDIGFSGKKFSWLLTVEDMAAELRLGKIARSQRRCNTTGTYLPITPDASFGCPCHCLGGHLAQ